jgi:hypothetical protein
VQVGPCFFATAGEPLALGEYAATIGFPDEDATSARWCRLGTDNGAEICVDPSGAVQAVFVVADASAMFVNSAVEAFAAALLALDQYLAVLTHRHPDRPGARSPPWLGVAAEDEEASEARVAGPRAVSSQNMPESCFALKAAAIG